MAGFKKFVSNSEEISSAAELMMKAAEYYADSIAEIEATINNELSVGDIGQAFEESYQTKYKQTLHDQITSLENVAQFVRETGDLYGDVTSQVMSAIRN